MKNWIIRLVGTIVVLAAIGQTSVKAQGQEPLYLFISEMETFTEKANELKTKAPDMTDEEIKVKVDELTTIAGRISKVYFAPIEISISICMNASPTTARFGISICYSEINS